MKITLDAGHSLVTLGKRTPDGMREWSFNSQVASYVADEFKQYEDVETQRVDDVSGKIDVPLSERTYKANKWGADAYISIHANAYGDGGWNNVGGIETFVHTDASRESAVLAKLVQEELIKATKRSDRSIKSANFAVLRSTRMPAILVECGFMTNKEEAALLKSDAYRKICANAIVKGLAAMYGLKKRESDSVLKHGSVGLAVKTLQENLNKLGHNSGTVDGVFGAGTENAVKRFQRATSITVDGIAGPQTVDKISASLAAINKVAAPKKESVIVTLGGKKYKIEEL